MAAIKFTVAADLCVVVSGIGVFRSGTHSIDATAAQKQEIKKQGGVIKSAGGNHASK